MLISFIIAYHNESDHLLRACLESILSLPLSEDEAEIIVIDDGSNRSAEDWVTSLSSIILYFRQENAGLSAARNNGIKLSKGEYVQFVDADDCLVTEVYARLLDLLRREGPDMVLFRFTDSVLTSCRSFRKTVMSGTLFLQHYNVRAAACCYVFNRRTLGETRFYPVILHEDELFTPQIIMRAEKLIETDAMAYYYRQHAGTITHTQTHTHIMRRLDDTLFVIRQLNAMNQQVLERRVRQLTMDYIYNVYRLTHSFVELRRRILSLREEQLFPIPVRCYGGKYLIFALLTRFFPLPAKKE